MLAQLAGVFDGDAESVHQARIATRRLREVLPLVKIHAREQVVDTVRAAGRELGRVRELDVMSSLLDSMSDRVPMAAATELHALRHEVRNRSRSARRSMVKQLERLDLRALPDGFSGRSHGGMLRTWVPGLALLTTPRWVGSIWTRIVERSANASEAAERAPAVYFPRRTHRARIAVKKLRYAVEVAAATDIWRPRQILKDLRRIQTILGDVHDVQVLLDLLDESSSTEESPGRSLLRELLEADLRRQYAEYARRRERIFHIANVCSRAAPRSRWRAAAPLVAASVFTAPVLLESVRSHTGRSSSPSQRRDEAVAQPLHVVG
jgi:CHAD domain-containing protein